MTNSLRVSQGILVGNLATVIGRPSSEADVVPEHIRNYPIQVIHVCSVDTSGSITVLCTIFSHVYALRFREGRGDKDYFRFADTSVENS